MSTTGWKKGQCKRGHVDPVRNKYGACILCAKEYRKENYQRNRERQIRIAIERAKSDPIARRDQQRAHRLGVPVDHVREAVRRCEGKCEACGSPLENSEMCIDHCHKTGRIRGVLCRFCNALEGILTNRAERVEKVRAYLLEREGGE